MYVHFKSVFCIYTQMLCDTYSSTKWRKTKYLLGSDLPKGYISSIYVHETFCWFCAYNLSVWTRTRKPLEYPETTCSRMLPLTLRNHCSRVLQSSVCRGDLIQPVYKSGGSEKHNTAKQSYRVFTVFKRKEVSCIVLEETTAKDQRGSWAYSSDQHALPCCRITHPTTTESSTCQILPARLPNHPSASVSPHVNPHCAWEAWSTDRLRNLPGIAVM